MSGYLRRLVASAAMPATTIHPVLRPIYSNPVTDVMGEPDAPSPADPIQPSEPRTRSERLALSPRLPANRDTPPDGARFVDEPAAPATQTVPPARSSFAASIEGERSNGSEDRSGSQLAPAISGSRRTDTHEFPGSTRAADPPRAIAVPERPFVPLVVAPANAQPSAPILRNEMLHSPRFDAGMNGPTADNRSARRSVSEPDDVQIHIGRIEVTAQHAPARATAMKPQRRAQSLDEYLQRRNGRAS